jgi:hypothetical protein
MSERETHANWMRQAAGCRRQYAKTRDRFWAVAARNSVVVAKSHRVAA